MHNVLIVDTETTGLDPENDRVIEVAGVLFNLPLAGMVSCVSTLVYSTEGNPAEAVNHIPGKLLSQGEEEPWNALEQMAKQCHAVLAHNADFDRQWVPVECHALLELPWIDTCGGITWPKETKPGQSLINLALEHGLAVVDPHRALSDCLLLAWLLSRCAELGHDLNELLAPGLRPTATFQARVSYDDRELAKAAGFKWDAAKRQWLRKMAIEDAANLGFQTVQVSA